MTDDDTPNIIVLLDGQVTDLKAQLEKSTAEKGKLLELLKNEQARTLALSPAAKPSFWQRMRSI